MLAAVGTLAAARLLGPVAAVAAMAFGALSWFFDPGTRAAALLARCAPVARLGATAFFALSAYEVWSRLPDPDLSPVLNLVLFLTVYKLFQRTANRDYLQVYVLAFLMVLAGAAFAHSFLFAAVFVVYVVLTTWTLVLLHLRREMEENYLVKHSGQAASHKVGVARILNSRRVVGPQFLGVTALVALAVFVGAVLTFALVPRVGAGFALGGARARRSLIGFSDEVTLGTSGFLSPENTTVALRAKLPRLGRLATDADREVELDHMYWRGTVYDTYEDGRWLRSRREALRTGLEEVGATVMVREPHTRPRRDVVPALASTDKQEIDVVGIAVPVAFALDHPVAFELPAPRVGAVPDLRLHPRWSGEVALQAATSELGAADDPGEDLRTFSGAHYFAYSRDPFNLTTASAGRPLGEIPREAIAPYLALPRGLTPRVGELARTITARSPTPAGKVVAVIDWLARTHEYSLNVGGRRAGGDPVEDFLFQGRAGHCEYFASAAALLLRSSGIPTRYVNGFLGGEWNAVGQYVTVRQNRAHAWVEAYLGELGWMRVDATPPVRPPARMGRIRQLLDSVEYFWSRWVVGYDLGRQLDLARRLGSSVGVAPPERADAPFSFPWKRLAVFVAALAAAGVLGWRTLRRRMAPRGPGAPSPLIAQQAVARLYRRCLERLAAYGVERRITETPLELVDRVRAAGFEAVEDFAAATDLYLQARFGRREIDDRRVLDLARRLQRLGPPGRLSRAA